MSSTNEGVAKPQNASRRTFLKYAGAGAAVVAVGAIAGSYYEFGYLPSQEASAFTVIYWQGGTTGLISELMVQLAKDSKYRMNPSWIPTANLGNATTDFAAGKADFNTNSINTIAAARVQGRPVQMVYQSVPATSTILVRPDSTYQSVADLKGKKVGITGTPSTTFIVAVANIQDKGVQINYKDFNYVSSNPLTLVKGLLGGEIEAAEFFEPIISQNVVPGKLKILTTANQEWKTRTGLPLFVSGVMVQEPFVKKNPDVVTRFIQLYIDAVNSLLNDQSIIVNWAKSTYQITDQSILDNLVKNLVQQYQHIPPFIYWGDKTISSIQEFLKLNVKVGAISAVPEGFLTTEYKPKGT